MAFKGLLNLPPRQISVVMVSGAMALCLLLLTAQAIQQHRLREAQTQSDELKVQLRRLTESLSRQREAAVIDFAAKLPVSMEPDAVTTDIQDVLLKNGVSLTALATHHQAPSLTSMGRHQWLLTLRGSYAGIKTAMAILGQRHTDLHIQNLVMRRQSAADIESKLSLVIYTRPLDLSATRNKD